MASVQLVRDQMEEMRRTARRIGMPREAFEDMAFNEAARVAAIEAKAARYAEIRKELLGHA